MMLRRLATTATIASYLMLPMAALAKGGHGSHASGGHGGHATGGHASHSSGSHAGGHSNGGQSHGGATSHGASSHGSAAPRPTSTTRAVPTAPTGSRSRDGRPVTGTAVG